MGWVITYDYIDNGANVGVGENPALVNYATTIPFELFDGDDVLYFEGLIDYHWLHGSAEFAFAPLDAAQQKYGCTSMTIFENGEWKEL